jgi:hypothetical protein
MHFNIQTIASNYRAKTIPFILTTLVTLLAFAAISLLNRGALRYELIRPREFIILRVALGP